MEQVAAACGISAMPTFQVREGEIWVPRGNPSALLLLLLCHAAGAAAAAATRHLPAH